MVYNKRSTEWLSKGCLYFAVVVLAAFMALNIGQPKPELELLNSLEIVNQIHLIFKSLL